MHIYDHICIYMCVCVYMIEVIATNRILDENTISALFCSSFYRLANYSFFIWWASLNQASSYQIPRVASVMSRLGGFVIKESSVTWSLGNTCISK